MKDRPPMEISVRESAGVSVLEVRGRLTIGEPAEQLHDALESVVKGGAKKVVVLLNGIPQIDSSGISTLVRISIKLAREGGVLRLVCGPGRVRDALTVTRLIEAIPTFESESAALQNFAELNRAFLVIVFGLASRVIGSMYGSRPELPSWGPTD